MSKAVDDHPFIAFWRSTKFFDVRIPKEVVIGNMQWGLALRTLQRLKAVARKRRATAGPPDCKAPRADGSFRARRAVGLLLAGLVGAQAQLELAL